MTPSFPTPECAKARCKASRPIAAALAACALMALSACQFAAREQAPVSVAEPPAEAPPKVEKQAEELVPDRKLVARLQRQLTTVGYDPGPVDGLLGPKTIGAIEAYQRANGRLPDGHITRPLLAELAAEAAARIAEAEHDPPHATDGAAPEPAQRIEIAPRHLPGSRYLYSDGTVLEFAATASAQRPSPRSEIFGGRQQFTLPPQTWLNRDQALGSGGSGQTVTENGMQWRCRHGDSETLTVIAGRFETHKLICERLAADRSIEMVRTWYYAPTLRHFVRRIDARNSGHSAPPVDLVGIQPTMSGWPPAAQAGLAWATQHALQSLPVGKAQPWRSSAVAPSVVIKPGSKIDWSGQESCRRYRQIWTVNGEDWIFPTVACRDESGAWKFPGLPDSNRIARVGTAPNP